VGALKAARLKQSRPDAWPERLFMKNVKKGYLTVLGRPGSDLLFRVLGRSTIGSEAFNDRVRDGIGFGHLDIATRPAKDRRRRMKRADRHART
jgi:hypothetical protein